MGRSFTLLVAIILSTSACFSKSVGHNFQWPEITEIDQSFEASLSRNGFQHHIDIMSETGQKLYKLSCYSGDDSDQDKWSSITPVIPIADLSCVMFGEQQNRPWQSLLSQAGDQRDYQSRGFFWKSQITGKCGTYLEYGRKRNFQLRGLELSIALSPTEQQNIWSVNVKIRNKQQNKSQWAEDPKVDEHIEECH